MVEGFGVGLWGDLGGEPASASAWKMLPKPPQLGGGRGLVRRASERERTEDAPEAATIRRRAGYALAGGVPLRLLEAGERVRAGNGAARRRGLEGCGREGLAADCGGADDA